MMRSSEVKGLHPQQCSVLFSLPQTSTSDNLCLSWGNYEAISMSPRSSLMGMSSSCPEWMLSWQCTIFFLQFSISFPLTPNCASYYHLLGRLLEFKSLPRIRLWRNGKHNNDCFGSFILSN